MRYTNIHKTRLPHMKAKFRPRFRRGWQN